MKTKIKLFDTYLTAIKNSVNSNIFRNLYVEIDGLEKDITENGNLSCALFVSSLLLIFKLIKDPHATVDGTVRDLKESGWTEITEPKIGCVLVWGKVDFGENNFHKHIGFYVGEKIAISNNSEKGFPTEHNFEFYGQRKIEFMLWHPKLDQK